MTTRTGTDDLPCPVDGCDGTIEVRFEVDPGQEEVRHPNRKAHPGYPPTASITDVVGRHDCFDHGDLTGAQIDRMEEANQDRMIESAAADERADREAHAERRMQERYFRDEYDI